MDGTELATTGGKQRPGFQPGQSGNPAGRPKGARDKLARDFIKALQADFAKHGVEAIEAMRESKPHEYVKAIASILPKEIDLGVDVTVSTLEQRQAAMAAWLLAQQDQGLLIVTRTSA